MKKVNILSFVIVVLFLLGCTSIPKDYSPTFENHKSTTIGQIFNEEAISQPTA